MEASPAQFHCVLSAARILLLGTPIDLLTAYKVAREFESISLRQAVWPAGDYPDRVVESARVRRLAAIKVHRRKSILCDAVYKWAASL